MFPWGTAQPVFPTSEFSRDVGHVCCIGECFYIVLTNTASISAFISMYVALYSTRRLPNTAETCSRWQMNVYCFKTCVRTDNKYRHCLWIICAIWSRYGDAVTAWIFIPRIYRRSPVELLYPSFLSVLLTKYYSYDQIKKNEMGGAGGTYGRQERCVQAFGGDPLGKE